MSVPLVVEGPKAPPPVVGLSDGGHVIPRCSDCNRPLADIFITQPNARDRRGEPFRWRVRATCAYGCKKPDGSAQTSFLQEFTGLYHLGGFGVDNPEDETDSEMKTAVVDTQFDAEGVLIITTKKV